MKIRPDADLKIIMSDDRNNYVGCSSVIIVMKKILTF